jgi:hypothetical protein
MARTQAGMQQQARGFAPGRTQLALYLHGPPGIGKSQLVTLLATSLQTLLRGFFAPHMAVQVVKLPLNSLTVAALHSISVVRGISDMSVERMIEQHLTKGNVVRPHALRGISNNNASAYPEQTGGGRGGA